MGFAAPQKRYVKHAERVCADDVTEFELHQAIRDLTKDKSALPTDPELRDILGVALFRAGREEDGLAELRAAFRMSQGTVGAGNLYVALLRGARYEELLDLQINERFHPNAGLLALAFLAGNYEKVRNLVEPGEMEMAEKIASAGLAEGVTRALRFFLGPSSCPGDSSIRLGIDSTDGELTVRVFVSIPRSPEEVAKESVIWHSTFRKELDEELLTRIVPVFEVLD